jgi:potassium-transporting ATPase KdpC subunit
MFSIVRPAASILALLTVLTGIVYPLAVAGSAQVMFPAQANGSLLEADGNVVGSRLIGQHFDDARYFWGRPSATAPSPYNAGASAGSNLAPTNPVLLTSVRERVVALRTAHPERASMLIPVDLVTASGSGLDPHISPAAALYQVQRVARARGLAEGIVRTLVNEHVEQRSLGFLGEPRVNAVLLNVALDGLAEGGS